MTPTELFIAGLLLPIVVQLCWLGLKSLGIIRKSGRRHFDCIVEQKLSEFVDQHKKDIVHISERIDRKDNASILALRDLTNQIERISGAVMVHDKILSRDDKKLNVAMIVDENKVSAYTIERIINDAGYQTYLAFSTEAGREMIDLRQFDAVFIDVDVQDDGVDANSLCRYIIGKYTNTSVVLYGNKIELAPPGARIIGKPFNAEEIAAVLHDIKSHKN